MTKLDYIKDRIAALRRISRRTGLSVFRLLVGYAISQLFHRACFEDYCAFKLYDRSHFWQSKFLTWPRLLKFVKKLNKNASQKDFELIQDKALFNAHFSAYIHRDWLYIPNSSTEELRSFILRNSTFLLKVTTGTQGQGITLFNNSQIDIDAFVEKYEGMPYLLEAFIRQHPQIAAPNPTSVNTVRIVTARIGNNVMFVGAGLRCGGSGSFVDNLHNGGAAYPINLETGIISGPGLDYRAENSYIRHPSTGHIMPGIQIPYWDNLLDTVREASFLTPIGYVGWDIAITESGIDVVEANVKYPGVTVIQLDRQDAYKRLKDFYKENSYPLPRTSL